MTQEISENQREYAKAVSEASSEIDAAKREWREAMEDVRKRAAESAAATEAAKKKASAATEATRQAQTRLANMSTQGNAVGAWSAQELDALLGGSNSAQERTAKATEESVRQQRETNKRLGRMEKSTGKPALSYS